MLKSTPSLHVEHHGRGHFTGFPRAPQQSQGKAVRLGVFPFAVNLESVLPRAESSGLAVLGALVVEQVCPHLLICFSRCTCCSYFVLPLFLFSSQETVFSSLEPGAACLLLATSQLPHCMRQPRPARWDEMENRLCHQWLLWSSVLNWSGFACIRLRQCCGDTSDTTARSGLLPACHGQTPGMLDILQCTGQCPELSEEAPPPRKLTKPPDQELFNQMLRSNSWVHYTVFLSPCQS